MDNKPITVNEAAEYLSVTPYQVRKYIREGLLKANRLGTNHGKTRDTRHLRIRAKDLDEFVAKNIAGCE